MSYRYQSSVYVKMVVFASWMVIVTAVTSKEKNARKVLPFRDRFVRFNFKERRIPGTVYSPDCVFE